MQTKSNRRVIGLHKAREINDTSMMKLVRGIIQRMDSLWVWVMRSKCGCLDNLLMVIHMNANFSNGWKEIS